jgi:hypothetical protein
MDGHGHEQMRDVTPVVGRGDLVGWGDLAACRGVGPAPFYGSAAEVTQGCCGRCRVDEVCFWFALATEEEAGYRFGIWAGTTPAVRARIATVIGADYARGRFLGLVGADRRPPVWEQS